jgi:hypothetical protein
MNSIPFNWLLNEKKNHNNSFLLFLNKKTYISCFIEKLYVQWTLISIFFNIGVELSLLYMEAI